MCSDFEYVKTVYLLEEKCIREDESVGGNVYGLRFITLPRPITPLWDTFSLQEDIVSNLWRPVS